MLFGAMRAGVVEIERAARMTDLPDHECPTCRVPYALWKCLLCDETYCIQCAPRPAEAIAEASYCGQQCKDAAEVVRALTYTGPTCIQCGARSDGITVGLTQWCSDACTKVWWRALKIAKGT